MGSTNKTTYYELSQFIGTDKPAWLQDYNGDMLKIDTGINAAKYAADNAQNSANNAQTDATDALTGVSNLNSDVSALETDMGTVQGAINTINSLIGNGTPTTQDQTIIGAINELDSDITNLENKPPLIANVDVSITADGVKTYADLFADLAESINTYEQDSDESIYYEIRWIGISSKYYLWQCPTVQRIFPTGGGNADNVYIGSSGNLTAGFLQIHRTSSNCLFRENSGGVYTDRTSEVPTSGTVITARLICYTNMHT